MNDEIRFGPRRERRRARRRWPGWTLAVAVAAVIVTLIATHQPNPRLRHRPDLLAPVRNVGHRLLGETADWRLVTYGPGGLIEVQPAAGRVTRTAVPALASTGPASFLTGPTQAVIRPLDGVTGYLVAVHHRARPLTGLLGHGGMAIPGPRPGQVWVLPDFGARSMTLSWLDGRSAGETVRLPRGTPWVPSADGRGYALVTNRGYTAAAGAVYDLRPGRNRRVPGFLVAVGADRWLMADCRHGRCVPVLLDPAAGTRRVLPGQVSQAELGHSGVIAPDGSAAAVLGVGPRQATLSLISLTTGAQRRIRVPLDAWSESGQTLAWSPDSRWLLVVAARGRVVAVSARTGRVQDLGVALPPVSQLAVQG
jgi:hypothetical protein